MTTDLPTDTIFEIEPIDPPLPAKAIELMKLFYLEFSKQLNLPDSWSPTQVIDSAESVRRQGYFILIQDTDGSMVMRLTDLGQKMKLLIFQGTRQ